MVARELFAPEDVVTDWVEAQASVVGLTVTQAMLVGSYPIVTSQCSSRPLHNMFPIVLSRCFPKAVVTIGCIPR
jgi:hypothetical protein